MMKSMFPSDTGCCICGIKLSSSRFTSSQKYEPMFPHVFLVCDRSGDFCNACVLVIKRYWNKYGRHNFLDVPNKQNWAHKVDQYSSGSRGARRKNIRGTVAAKKKVQVHKVIKKHRFNFKKKVERETTKVYLQDGVSNPYTNPYPSIYNREFREPFDLEKAFPTIIESEVEQVTSNSTSHYHNTRSTAIITESEEEEVKSSFSSYPNQQSSYLSQNFSYPSQNSSCPSQSSSYASQQSSRACSPVFPTPAQTPEYQGNSSRGSSPAASSLYSSSSAGLSYAMEVLDLSTRNSGLYNTPAPSPGESMDGSKGSRDTDDEMISLKSISGESSRRKQSHPRHKNSLPVLNNTLCTDYYSTSRVT